MNFYLQMTNLQIMETYDVSHMMRDLMQYLVKLYFTIYNMCMHTYTCACIHAHTCLLNTHRADAQMHKILCRTMQTEFLREGQYCSLRLFRELVLETVLEEKNSNILMLGGEYLRCE